MEIARSNTGNPKGVPKVFVINRNHDEINAIAFCARNLGQGFN
jgi:hypothetical protein